MLVASGSFEERRASSGLTERDLADRVLDCSAGAWSDVLDRGWHEEALLDLLLRHVG